MRVRPLITPAPSIGDPALHLSPAAPRAPATAPMRSGASRALVPVDLTSTRKALEALPGSVSFSVRVLQGQVSVPVSASKATQVQALGSTFKLYLLGLLAEDIAAGKRRWDDVVTLTESSKSLPSGLLQDFPTSAPLTLHSVASLMMAISDNTATDFFIDLLGRERVEAGLKRQGMRDPKRNAPFLKTLEVFKLKSSQELVDRYVAQDERGRRALLAGEVARMGRDLPSWEEPRAIDTIEWFASADDISRVFQSLLLISRKVPEVLDIIGISRHFGVEDKFRYIGYKGGSEPGVCCFSWLVCTKRGNWLTVSALWNDPKADVDARKLVDIMRGALERVAEL